MEIVAHEYSGTRIAEVLSEELLIKEKEDFLDLLGNLYYEGYDKVVVHRTCITDKFFELETGIAGEVLQKFSNYRVRLAIVGNFADLTRKSILDFIFESNKSGHINFVGTIEEAMEKLSKK